MKYPSEHFSEHQQAIEIFGFRLSSSLYFLKATTSATTATATAATTTCAMGGRTFDPIGIATELIIKTKEAQADPVR
jgi:hypothetical protein